MPKKKATSKPKTSARQKAGGCRRPSSGSAWCRLVDGMDARIEELRERLKMARQYPPRAMMSVQTGKAMLTTFGPPSSDREWDVKCVDVSVEELAEEFAEEILGGGYAYEDADVCIKSLLAAAKTIRQAKRGI